MLLYKYYAILQLHCYYYRITILLICYYYNTITTLYHFAILLLLYYDYITSLGYLVPSWGHLGRLGFHGALLGPS